jgi:hypothetical protein
MKIAATAGQKGPLEILRDNAGARESRRNAQTGTVVTLYDGREAGMDTSSGRWYVFCEDHGQMLNGEVQATVRSMMTCPLDWCESCSPKAVK